MEIVLARVVTRSGWSLAPAGQLHDLYLDRIRRFSPVSARTFASQDKLLRFLDEAAARTRPLLLAADSAGDPVTSTGLAEALRRALDAGTQTLVFAIGPADGWSTAALQRADRKVSFGRITLPHELAAVVASEQIYRALTVLAGHPYHTGH